MDEKKWKGNDPRESALVEVLQAAFEAGARAFFTTDPIAKKFQEDALPNAFYDWLEGPGKRIPLSGHCVEMHGVPRVDAHVAHVFQTTSLAELLRLHKALELEVHHRDQGRDGFFAEGLKRNKKAILEALRPPSVQELIDGAAEATSRFSDDELEEHAEHKDAPFVAFYQGMKPKHCNWTLDEIREFSTVQMEQVHDYIQWLFPGQEPSKFRPEIPTITDAEVEVFRTDPVLRVNVKTSMLQFLEFLKRTTHWREEPHSHNLLRITRMLKFLTLVDLHEDAEFALGAVMSMLPSRFNESVTFSHWLAAMPSEEDQLEAEMRKKAREPVEVGKRYIAEDGEAGVVTAYDKTLGLYEFLRDHPETWEKPEDLIAEEDECPPSTD